MAVLDGKIAAWVEGIQGVHPEQQVHINLEHHQVGTFTGALTVRRVDGLAGRLEWSAISMQRRVETIASQTCTMDVDADTTCSWACQDCTFENTPDANLCAMCAAEAPADRPANHAASELVEEVQQIMGSVQELRVQAIAQSKPVRKRMLLQLQLVQGQLDMLGRLAAEMQRKGTRSTAALARANEIRFVGRFSKARRQRAMDKRAIENSKASEQMEQSLIAAAASVPQDELRSLIQPQTDEMYKCMLSQCDLSDVLSDTEDFSEVLGFGLAVTRPEHVIDAPSEIRIHSISGAILSKSATEDAIQHAIGINGSQLRAFSNSQQVTEALVGSYGHQDPINAWLPLYIHKFHWERVRLLLKPSFGSFFTLDPLGFASNQIHGMLMVLAKMALEAGKSEQAAKMFFAFWRTSVAVVAELGETEALHQMLTGFKESQVGRGPDVVASLWALLGAALVAPCTVQQELLSDERWDLSFWGEVLRRAARSMLRTAPPAVGKSVVALVCGASSMPAAGVEAVFHCGPAVDAAEATDTVVQDEVLMSAPPQAPKYRDKKLDAAMGVLGKHAAGALPGSKLKADAAAATAKQLVDNACVKLGNQHAASAFQEADEEQATSAAAAIADRLMQSSAISLDDVQVLLALLRWFASHSGVGTDALDAHGGVAPAEWIESMRECHRSALASSLVHIVPEPSVLRTMVGLSARYQGSGDARSAANRGVWHDPWEQGKMLELWKQEFAESRQEYFESARQAAVMREMNCVGVSGPSLWSFCGYLNRIPGRDIYLNHVYSLLADHTFDVPDRAAKVRICVTGKYDEHTVFDRGNAVLPSDMMCMALEQVLGEDVWREIEIKARSRSAWTYRCSCSYVTGAQCSLANRHGHCNGKPYGNTTTRGSARR